MKLPTLSVVVPNYNHARHLPGCLNAILGQSAPAAEIIIIDDGSTDNSVEVIEDFARRHPSIRFYRNESNRGVTWTCNRGAALATGDFLVIPGADDEVQPGFFEKSLRLLAEYPQAGACGSICQYRDMTSGLSWYLGTAISDRPCFFPPEQLVGMSRTGRLLISTSSMILHRQSFLDAGSYLADLRWHSDWFAFFVVGFRRGICFVPEPLAEFRIYSSSFSNQGMRRSQDQRAVLLRMLEYLELPEYRDAAERFREGAAFASFGWVMLRLLAGERKYRKYLTPGYLRAASWWIAKLTARRLLPDPLARFCLRVAGYQKLPAPKPA